MCDMGMDKTYLLHLKLINLDVYWHVSRQGPGLPVLLNFLQFIRDSRFSVRNIFKILFSVLGGTTAP